MRRRTPNDETFDEVRGLIYKLVNQFLGNYPNLNRDDVEEAALYGYALAYHSYDYTTAFPTWVGYHVQKRMLDVLRDLIKRRKRYAIEPLTGNEVGSCQPEVRRLFNEWVETLSPDAKKVAYLVFETPIDIKAILAQFGNNDAGAWRQAFREFLKEQGWDDKRTKAAFTEIKLKLMEL